MSTFTTNNNTRHTKRARVNNIRQLHSNQVVGAVPFKSLNNKIDLTKNGRNPSLVETSIGSTNSKGLLIIGGAASSDTNNPKNPDDREIPLGESGESSVGKTPDTLAYPPHPITFSGPGYLKFQNEIGVPSIRGDVQVNGNLLVFGSVTSEKGELGADPPPPPVIAFSPVIEDSTGATLDGVTVVASYETNAAESTDYFDIRISWTGKTSISDINTMRVVGFPYIDYLADTTVFVTSPTGVFSSELGGYIVMTVRGGGDNGFDLKTHSMMQGGAPQSILGENFLDSGSLIVSGHLKRV